MSPGDPKFPDKKTIQEILEGKGYQPRNAIDPRDFQDLFDNEDED